MQFARPSGLVGRLFLGPWLNRISREMNRLTLAQLDLQPDDDVLEVGFGGGALLAEIVERTSGRVFGVDVSRAMVSRARARFRARIDLYQAPVHAMPIGDCAADKACSVNNIYFWPDPQAAMRELARIVRAGGTLSICFEPPEELRKWPGHRYGFRLYDEAEVRDLMEQAGFTSIRRAEGRGHRPDYFLCLTGMRAGAEAAA